MDDKILLFDEKKERFQYFNKDILDKYTIRDILNYLRISYRSSIVLFRFKNNIYSIFNKNITTNGKIILKYINSNKIEIYNTDDVFIKNKLSYLLKEFEEIIINKNNYESVFKIKITTDNITQDMLNKYVKSSIELI